MLYIEHVWETIFYTEKGQKQCLWWDILNYL